MFQTSIVQYYLLFHLPHSDLGLDQYSLNRYQITPHCTRNLRIFHSDSTNNGQIGNLNAGSERAGKTGQSTSRTCHDTIRTQILNWRSSCEVEIPGFWCGTTRCHGPVPGRNWTPNRTGNLDPFLTLVTTVSPCTHHRTLTIYLEAKIELVWRCTWRPRSSELRDALGGRNRSSLELHWEAVIERLWRCTLRPRLSELRAALGGRD
jgi:hypothetical protein